MEPYQVRVVNELKALSQKRYDLGLFLTSAKLASLPEDEQTRLRAQYDVMRQYESILQDRIDHFPGSELHSLTAKAQ